MITDKIRNSDGIQNVQKILNLLDDTPADKRYITEKLDISRVTVDRHIRGLEEQSLVKYSNRKYRLTPKGKMIHEVFITSLNTMEKIHDVGNALNNIQNEFLIDSQVFQTGEVITPDKFNAEKPISSLEEPIKNASQIKFISDHLIPRYNNILFDRMEKGSLSMDVILENSLVQHLETKDDEGFNKALDEEQLSLWSTDENIPVSLMIFDQKEMSLVIHKDHRVEAVIKNESTYAIRWGTSIFNKYINNAKKKSRKKIDIKKED